MGVSGEMYNDLPSGDQMKCPGDTILKHEKMKAFSIVYSFVYENFNILII